MYFRRSHWELEVSSVHKECVYNDLVTFETFRKNKSLFSSLPTISPFFCKLHIHGSSPYRKGFSVIHMPSNELLKWPLSLTRSSLRIPKICKPLTYDEIQWIIDVSDPYSILATTAWLLIMDRRLVKPSFALSSPKCLLAVRWNWKQYLRKRTMSWLFVHSFSFNYVYTSIVNRVQSL